LDAQRNRKPVILLTCYYGPYDLLPLLLGYNGIEAAAIYKPHANPQYDAFRNAVRSASGCELVPLHRALVRLPEILESGGAAAILADHVSTKRGVAGQFLGLPMVIPRTVGILAQRYAAIVVVAGMRRRRRAFRFEFVVSDFFDPATWQNHAYPVTYVTHRYIAAMERLILQDPAQYLWTRSRRNVERAARITEGAAIAASGPLAVAGNVDNGARQP
jgi:KDO2-lipid IV(A) lauroyltransferase